MKETRAITPAESEALKMLFDKVTFLPGSYDKRFVHGMYSATKITQAQSDLVVRMCYRYRRQLGMDDNAARKYQNKLIHKIAEQLGIEVVNVEIVT